MSIPNTTPSNRNFLSSLKFRFIINKAPMTTYFAQSVHVPGMVISNIEFQNPFIQIPYSGEHIEFDSHLELNFLIDEDMKNYLEIHNWLISLGFPDDFSQYAEIATDKSNPLNGVKSDVTIMVLDSKENEIFNIIFSDAFPTSISGINFDAKSEDVEYIQATATFRFARYYIVKSN